MLCPHCQQVWLSVKNSMMSIHEQIDLFEKVMGDWKEAKNIVVPDKQDVAWVISGRDFETMTVTPSLDASASGHWHGFITAGNIITA
jgi:hypothetical protein